MISYRDMNKSFYNSRTKGQLACSSSPTRLMIVKFSGEVLPSFQPLVRLGGRRMASKQPDEGVARVQGEFYIEEKVLIWTPHYIFT